MLAGAPPVVAPTRARVGKRFVLLVGLVALLLPLAPAPSVAGTRAAPGSFTGYAFDTCDTPSQRQMNAWRRHSKFWGVGVYIAGMNRACSTQRHLTRRWVATQSR